MPYYDPTQGRSIGDQSPIVPQKKPLMLFRAGLEEEGELLVAEKYFEVCQSVTDPRLKENVVVGRYSCLPFYKEREQDMKLVGSRFINSFAEHSRIADLGEWVPLLEGLTPRTWVDILSIPDDLEHGIILKGATNSRKFLWKTHMFAKDKEAAQKVLGRLLDDSLIGQQRIYYREFVPLKTYHTDMTGIPVSDEYRLFVFNDQVISRGFYWSQHYDTILEETGKAPDPFSIPESFLEDVLSRLKGIAPFYVVDVAQTQSGEWIVIELNDGQMSGLSMNDPNTLYQNLAAAVVSTQPRN